MRIFYDNKADAATVTASSENALLPAVNVSNELRSLPWRTGASTAAEWIKFDMGSAVAVTAFILCDHTLSSDTSVAIEANSSDSWGSPAFTQSVTVASGTVLTTFSSQSYRWWRFRFTKPSAGTERDIGRVFLGTYLEPSEAPDFNGVTIARDDNTTKVKSVGGQEWSNLRASFRTVKLDFSAVSNTTRTNLDSFAVLVGTGVSFFLQVDTSSAFSEVLYVRNSKMPTADLNGYDSDFRWDCSLDMVEQI